MGLFALALVGAGFDDLLLLFGHLQGVGPGVAAVGHQIRDGQKGADQHFFIIFAGIAAAVVVGEHRGGQLAGALLLEIVEMVADLAERPLGLFRLAVGQGDDRSLERNHVAFLAMALADLVDRFAGAGQIAGIELLAHQANVLLVGRAASRRQSSSKPSSSQADAAGRSRRTPRPVLSIVSLEIAIAVTSGRFLVVSIRVRRWRRDAVLGAQLTTLACSASGWSANDSSPW